MKKLIIILFLSPLFCKAQELDTVKVIMLVSDTSKYLPQATYTYGMYKISKETYVNKLNWIYGYAVREKESDPDCGTCPAWWKTVAVLDEQKSLLSKNLIVWDAKQIQ